jgi:hypothetical protein
VETPFGYHIIKRPPPDVVRERLTNYLIQTASTRLDSIYMDSLALQNRIKVAKGAAGIMRKAPDNPDESRRSKTKLATFKDGELTVSEFMRWVQALPPQYTTQLKQADDSMLTQFARVLSQNMLLLRQADSAKIQVTPEEWNGMAANYRSQLDTLQVEMGLDTASLRDSTVTSSERNRLVAIKVDQYLDRLASGTSRLRSLPATLATRLRDGSPYRIHDAGINRAVELAEAERQKADSAKAKAGPVKPAPGPAPIPGVTPAPGESTRPAPTRRDSAQPKRDSGPSRMDSTAAKPNQ